MYVQFLSNLRKEKKTNKQNNKANAIKKENIQYQCENKNNSKHKYKNI